MNMPYLGESTDIILGQEFLTWLWYQSDTAPGAFTDKDGAPFSVSMEQRIVYKVAKETPGKQPRFPALSLLCGKRVLGLEPAKKSAVRSSGLKKKNWPSRSRSRQKIFALTV